MTTREAGAVADLTEPEVVALLDTLAVWRTLHDRLVGDWHLWAPLPCVDDDLNLHEAKVGLRW